jgi:hypothetical protein
MQKVVINKVFGGFCLSREAGEMLGIKPGFRKDGDVYLYEDEMSRDDARLVEVVETLGEKAWGRHAELKVVEVPDGVEWSVHEYDGAEWIAEKHRTWS